MVHLPICILFWFEEEEIQPLSCLGLVAQYLSTLADLTLIILFSEMLKFSKKYFFQIEKYCEET
jgi:hypothetical protein